MLLDASTLREMPSCRSRIRSTCDQKILFCKSSGKTKENGVQVADCSLGSAAAQGLA